MIDFPTILFIIIIGLAIYCWPKPDRVRQGYEYAKNEFARLGNKASGHLAAKICEAKTFGDYSDFDRGIEKAIQEHFQDV